jgi:hypothetical protein
LFIYCLNEKATIESCLLHGLKKRAVGLFKTSTTMSLVQKISKNCDSASIVVKLCDEYDNNYCNSNSIGSNATGGHVANTKKSSASSSMTTTAAAYTNGRSYAPTYYKGSNCYKFLWIRMALLNKLLTKIIEHIVLNANAYYMPHALVADPVDGPIFSSLLVGPCALEYTKMKMCDQLWNDPNADELIQRHRMHSSFSHPNSTHSLIHYNTVSTFGTGSIANAQEVAANGSGSAAFLFNSSGAAGSPVGIIHSTSPKAKPGLNASIIAKRKASMNAIDETPGMMQMQTQMLPPLPNGSISPLMLKHKYAATASSAVSSPVGPLNPASTATSSSASTLAPISPLQLMLSSSQSTGLTAVGAVGQANGMSVGPTATVNTAKDYVESLHQNSKSQLIYGKNHVVVQQVLTTIKKNSSYLN